MITAPTIPSTKTRLCLHRGAELADRMTRLEAFAMRGERVPLSRHPGWLRVLGQSLGHDIRALEALDGEETRGFLPLVYVRSLLFGRYLCSLPYLNSGGVITDDPATAKQLLDHAVTLANELNVRHLEVRHEQPVEHADFIRGQNAKVHMRLSLPTSAGKLWDQIGGKVRNQIRKGQKNGLVVVWGREELLPEFHAVFSRNMRDLGTPAYGRSFFGAILQQFPDAAELCVVRAGSLAVAGGLLLHGRGVAEVPSASSLREYNQSCANMLLYWNLLQRAVDRKHVLFDFGRSTVDGPTYRFKKQWGALPQPASWQYYSRRGSIDDARPDNPRYRRLIQIWQRLPLFLTRFLGPAIVRGIP